MCKQKNLPGLFRLPLPLPLPSALVADLKRQTKIEKGEKKSFSSPPPPPAVFLGKRRGGLSYPPFEGKARGSAKGSERPSPDARKLRFERRLSSAHLETAVRKRGAWAPPRYLSHEAPCRLPEVPRPALEKERFQLHRFPPGDLLQIPPGLILAQSNYSGERAW